MIKRSPCGCGGVSLQSDPGVVAEAGVNSICHGFLGGVTAHQNHVVPNPRVVLIYWDQYFTDTPAAVTSMDQFVSDLATGNYWDGLSQYGVGAASFVGHVVINMTTFPTPNSQNPGQAFSASQMQSQLIAWLDNGVVTPKPAGDEENLVYFILAPSDTTLSGPTVGFCGYHEHGKYNASTSRDNLIWGTVTGWNQATTGQSFVDSISYCVSHELSESFTNPDGQGYFNDNLCEIGDICEAPANGPCCTTVPYKNWQVENYWSNLDARCIIGPSTLTAGAQSSLACFGVNGSDSRVYYLDSSNHVNELAWEDGWVHNDITALTGAAPAIGGSALACFGVNGSDSRVYYLDSNNVVNELAWDNRWVTRVL
jgi:hypothetical protein